MRLFEIEPGDAFSVKYTDLQEMIDTPCKIKYGLILLCLSGQAQCAIQLNTFVIEERTMAILFPHSIVTVNQLSSDFRMVYVIFSKPLMDEAVFRLGPTFFRYIREHPCYKHEPESFEVMKSRLDLMRIIYEDRQNIYRDIIIKNQLQNFFLDVYDKTRHVLGDGTLDAHQRSEELFHKFISLVHEHFQIQRNVAFYARELCISPRYLSTVCRHITHESAKTVIDRHIILEVKVMLHSSKKNIQEISNVLDFPSQSYLGRFFKKHTGLSPSEYRDKMRR